MSAPDPTRPPARPAVHPPPSPGPVARRAAGPAAAGPAAPGRQHARPGSGSRAAPLLVVVDPVARLTDGESVRIARDVLRAGSYGLKLCLPEDPEETARALARRGSRRPVLVGNDRALLRTVRLLHREGELAGTALSVVPVGNGPSVALARSLGLPLDVVTAARTVLRGRVRARDLLADDEGDVVLGGLRVEPAAPLATGPELLREGLPTAARSPWWRRGRLLPRTVRHTGDRPGRSPAAPPHSAPPAPLGPAGYRLRVEADGAVLAEPGRPVSGLSVRTAEGTGLADVVVGASGEAAAPRVRARTVTVTAAADGFRYRPDADGLTGPVATRTWTVLPRSWRLVLPPPEGE
ncbi:hypothetical protein SALCHL_003516 [Streptomyces albus subsp. chlorinus]|uniref:hypothetical protein n=2 Tax=Streptomyces albus TaxID=1888 RepID=UPI003D0F4AB5